MKCEKLFPAHWGFSLSRNPEPEDFGSGDWMRGWTFCFSKMWGGEECPHPRARPRRYAYPPWHALERSRLIRARTRLPGRPLRAPWCNPRPQEDGSHYLMPAVPPWGKCGGRALPWGAPCALPCALGCALRPAPCPAPWGAPCASLPRTPLYSTTYAPAPSRYVRA